ncbi:MAG: hypothetical protein IPK62_05305 [Bacteroidetes bacterium]|nr:hypothetical protein [Bacteroidota bacterium]
MDPQATNYNAAASINDGSCLYNATYYALAVKDSFANALSEISGMVYWNGKLYAHADSGNPAIVFETDTTTGTITKEVFLQGVNNVDWEDIAQDNTHFYIADVGNNAGDRTDLRIYKFPKATIGPAYYDTVWANEIEIIQFSYPDQVNFASNPYNTPFDCEAIAFRNNALHLFTKNWTLGACVHYTIPNTAGNYTAVRIDSINTLGTLITAADFASNKQLMMIGYQNAGTAECALWYIYDFDASDSIFIKGNKRKITLGDALLLGQVEAICFADSNRGFASNEHFNPIAPVDVAPKLYGFGTKNWFPYQINTRVEEVFIPDFQLLTKVEGNSIRLYFSLEKAEQIHISLFRSKGRKLRERNFHLQAGKQRLSFEDLDLPAGMYQVLLQNGSGLKKISKIFFEKR